MNSETTALLLSMKVNSRNPNLTTTQPCLNLVGFYIIIAVYTSPPHSPTNSTSNGKNDPRDLKFCMLT